MDDLLDGDLAAAAEAAAGLVPDFVSQMDRLVPEIAAGGDRGAVLRYYFAVESAAQTLTALPSDGPESAAGAEIVRRLLRQDAAELAWVAPSADGIGVLTALVDRLRGLVGGLPQQCGRADRDWDEQRFCWFLESLADIDVEQRITAPLKRAMATLALSRKDVAALMGVTRQAVEKWLRHGPPVARLDKIATVAEIADILRYRLREGLPAAVARRPAEVYGGRSMLEVIAQDDHDWLLSSVRESFDFASVA